VIRRGGLETRGTANPAKVELLIKSRLFIILDYATCRSAVRGRFVNGKATYFSS
jgi:hypothetical protein